MTSTPRVSKPGSIRCESLQAPQEQAGGDERHERQRNLRDDQHLTEAEQPRRAAAAVAGWHVLVLQHRNDVGRDACIAGARPNSKPVATASAA